MFCPQCNAMIRDMTYEGLTVGTCDGCGGEFIKPEDLGSIVRTREQVFGDKLKALYEDHKPTFGIPDAEAERQLICPACEGVMRPVNYACDTGVIVDRCDRCGGAWLEHGELEKMQILCEEWQDKAPAQLKKIAAQLEDARKSAAAASSPTFSASRFSFVNAVINRFLDAA